jgi:hypothetical protein
MSHIVMIKQRGVSVAYSRANGVEAVALALRLLHRGETDVSIVSPRGWYMRLVTFICYLERTNK